MALLSRRLLASVVAALALVGLTLAVGSAGAQDDGEKVVLTVGVTSNAYDTLNPLVGYSVLDYDVWIPQYDTVTRKAADDFAVVPGLAESWEGSDDGLTYTYKLREGLQWSDGEPLTADDVAFTINRSREEEWQNFSAYTKNLTAKVIDERTVEVTSSVPDPKLPSLGDTYILPEHIWGKLSPAEITKYPGEDGVGSGPFLLDEFKRGQYVRMKANESYWEGKRPVDEIIFRIFNNPDAMVAALERGEIDAAHNVPSQAFRRVESTEGIVAVEGNQGGFDEIAINGGSGLQKPHPALLDRDVRVAIAHAIDKQTLLDQVYEGIGSVAETVSPSPDPVWVPEIPEAERFDFDPERANQILDEAGYEDTDGDGVREMPGGGDPLRFSYYVRSNSEVAPPVAEYVAGWLEDIGIDIEQKFVDSNQLGPVIGKGEYDMFHWSWTPYVDPDQQLSYFQCDQIATADDPTLYNNDANWCDPEYDRLYKEQNVELDKEKRVELVHQMLRRFHDTAFYQVFALTPDLQAYRTDRFTGWLRQPAAVGPVIFSNTTPTYFNLTPLADSGDGGGGGISSGAIIGIVVAAVAVVGGILLIVSRRRSVEERE
jgi:peptide/nickel transport system substrate-binding protein